MVVESPSNLSLTLSLELSLQQASYHLGWPAYLLKRLTPELLTAGGYIDANHLSTVAGFIQAIGTTGQKPCKLLALKNGKPLLPLQTTNKPAVFKKTMPPALLGKSAFVTNAGRQG
jgi:hypothetical protein